MKITGQTKLTAVIGNNIGYSLSPAIHNYWYDLFKLNRAYVPIEAVDENFEFVVKGLFAAGFLGMNVTVPFKERAYQLAENLTEEAKKAKAANVLYQKDGVLVGHNTDGEGLIGAILSLDPSFSFKDEKCLIIGTGGASSGIISSLLEKGLRSINILNRNFEKAKSLALSYSTEYRESSINAVASYKSMTSSYDLVIQATTLKSIEPHNLLDFPLSILHEKSLVIDINYGFSPNDFLLKASQKTSHITDGLTMLIEQARPSFSLFNRTEIPPNSQELRDFLQLTT